MTARRIAERDQQQAQSLEEEAEREACKEFVFAGFQASDGSETLVVTLRCDWEQDQAMGDSYSEEQLELISQACVSQGFQAWEMSESNFELSIAGEEAHKRLRNVPGLIEDPGFINFARW